MLIISPHPLSARLRVTIAGMIPLKDGMPKKLLGVIRHAAFHA
jgi:hypothetical protein